MIKSHAKKIDSKRKAHHAYLNGINAQKIFGNMPKETTFCGERGHFTGCIPSPRLNNMFYGTQNNNETIDNSEMKLQRKL